MVTYETLHGLLRLVIPCVFCMFTNHIVKSNDIMMILLLFNPHITNSNVQSGGQDMIAQSKHEQKLWQTVEIDSLDHFISIIR